MNTLSAITNHEGQWGNSSALRLNLSTDEKAAPGVLNFNQYQTRNLARKITLQKPIKKSRKQKIKYAHHPKNPYSSGSYATCFDILAAHKNGLHRNMVVTLLAQATQTTIRNARFNANIVLNATESNTGFRHRSAKEGYWILKENDHVTLMIDL